MRDHDKDGEELDALTAVLLDCTTLRRDFERMAGPSPQAVYNIAREGEGRHRHEPFLACCNYLHAPRQIELFRFSYFSELARTAATLTDLLNKDGADLVFVCFSIRRLLELIAYVHRATEQIEKLAEKLQHFRGINPSLITEPPARFDIQIFEDVNSSLFKIRVPSTLDWGALRSCDVTTSLEKRADRTENILKSLKALDQRIPATHPIYSFCSEIVHPNAMVAISSWDFESELDFESGDGQKKLFWKATRSSELQAFWLYFVSSVLRPRFSEFTTGTRQIMSQDSAVLKKVEKDLMQICRPIARAGFKKYVDSSQPDFDELDCPCGARKVFRKCCGRG